MRILDGLAVAWLLMIASTSCKALGQEVSSSSVHCIDYKFTVQGIVVYIKPSKNPAAGETVSKNVAPALLRIKKCFLSTTPSGIKMSFDGQQSFGPVFVQSDTRIQKVIDGKKVDATTEDLRNGTAVEIRGAGRQYLPRNTDMPITFLDSIVILDKPFDDATDSVTDKTSKTIILDGNCR